MWQLSRSVVAKTKAIYNTCQLARVLLGSLWSLWITHKHPSSRFPTGSWLKSFCQLAKKKMPPKAQCWKPGNSCWRNMPRHETKFWIKATKPCTRATKPCTRATKPCKRATKPIFASGGIGKNLLWLDSGAKMKSNMWQKQLGSAVLKCNLKSFVLLYCCHLKLKPAKQWV